MIVIEQFYSWKIYEAKNLESNPEVFGMDAIFYKEDMEIHLRSKLYWWIKWEIITPIEALRKLNTPMIIDRKFKMNLSKLEPLKYERKES